MKPLRSLLYLFCFTGGALLAQDPVPNSGMENWSGGEPVGWQTNNGLGAAFIAPSSDARSGSLSAQGTTINLGGQIIPPFLSTNVTGDPYFPITRRYGSFRFWYKWTPAEQSDALSAFAEIRDAAFNDIAIADTVFLFPTGDWTLVELPFDYAFGNGNPAAWAAINFLVLGLPDLNAGSTFFLDDLELVDPISGIRQQFDGAVVEDFALEQNYPNPFNPETTIRFAVPKTAEVQLAVYNARGQEVARLVDGTMTAGTYLVDWNAADLASGVYFYTLRSAGQSLTRRMLLVK